MISNRASATAARARRARFLSLGAVLLLVAAAALWRAPLSSLLWSLLAPVMQARHVGVPGDATASTQALLADRETLYAENVELKRLLGRAAGVERVLAGVLLRPPATPYDTLVIDAGVAEGVAVGDRVSAGGTTLIGVVSETYAHAARVVLYSAPGETHEGLLRLSGQGGSIPLVIEGQGGGSLRAQVPSGTSVEAGDSVVFPGVLGGVSARVTHVDRADNESFAIVYLQLPVAVSSLRFIEVWKEISHDIE